MPKVDNGYLEKKMNDILDAAARLHSQRPLHTISMKDLVRETKLSQGGVYRYFSNIEDVWLALSYRYEREIDFRELVDSAFQDENTMPLRLILGRFFSDLAKEIRKSLHNEFAKLAFEFNAIFISRPNVLSAQQLQQQAQLSEQIGYRYLFGRLTKYMEASVQRMHLQPSKPLPVILLFIQASLDGIIRNLTIEQYMPNSGSDGSVTYASNLDLMLESLLEAVLHQLGYVDDKPASSYAQHEPTIESGESL